MLTEQYCTRSPALLAGCGGPSRPCRRSNAQHNHGSVQVLDSRWPIPAFAGYEQMGAVWRATSGPRPGVSRYSRLGSLANEKTVVSIDPDRSNARLRQAKVAEHSRPAPGDLITLGRRDTKCLVLIRQRAEASPTMSAWVPLMPYMSDYVRYGCVGNNYCHYGDCLARASRMKQVSHFRSIAYEEMDI